MVIVKSNPMLNAARLIHGSLLSLRIGFFAVLRYECLGAVRHGNQWGVLLSRLVMVEFGPLFLQFLEKKIRSS